MMAYHYCHVTEKGVLPSLPSSSCLSLQDDRSDSTHTAFRKYVQWNPNVNVSDPNVIIRPFPRSLVGDIFVVSE